MEVRCCCQPTKLLGHLSVGSQFENQVIYFHAGDEVVSLKIRHYYPSGRAPGYFALSSEDVPIEKLRAVSGFVEVVGEEGEV